MYQRTLIWSLLHHVTSLIYNWETLLGYSPITFTHLLLIFWLHLYSLANSYQANLFVSSFLQSSYLGEKTPSLHTSLLLKSLKRWAPTWGWGILGGLSPYFPWAMVWDTQARWTPFLLGGRGLGIHFASFEAGLYFLVLSLIILDQLHPNGWAQLVGFTILSCYRDVVLSLHFLELFL